MRHFQLLLPLIYLLTGVFLDGSAQSIATEKLPNKLSVLNGRAFFNFPQEAQNSARQVDIMSADCNTNLETRIVYDRRDMRLVFFAQELYAVGDKRLLTQVVTASNDKSKATTKILADNAKTFAILSTPTVFDEKADAILINSLLVKTVNSTIFQIQAYINPAANKKRGEFVALTERVFRSVEAGTRTNNRSAHSEVLDLFEGTKKLKIRLPADYSVTVDQKYDFQVVKFHQYRRFGARDFRTLLVYVGRHPSLMYRNFGFRKEQAKEVDGLFLGQPIRWMTFSDTAKGLYIKEQQVSGAQIEEGLILHVGMKSDQAAALDEMTRIIAGIELTK